MTGVMFKAKMTFDDIIGENPKFREIIRIAKSAPNSGSGVLLLGESGTGKDAIAQAMHNNSKRKNEPYVAINCAAMPRELIASELFGYESGAFTGAKKGGSKGKFELAHQGTIFLDEIGDVPVDQQVVFLRVLEEKSITRLGGSKPVPVNVRVIAATSKNIEEEMAQNRFRRELYYRLAIIKLYIPPLRERLDDIPRLSEHFLQNLSLRLGEPIKKLSAAAVDTLMKHDWPGNIRELQNVLEAVTQLTTENENTSEFIKNYLHP